MPDMYTVTAVTDPTPWKNDPSMLSYGLEVSHPDATAPIKCEQSRKGSSPPPAVGEVIEGVLEPSKNPSFPPKLKRAFKGASPGGGPRVRDPKETAQIVRQHSQTAVAALLLAKATAGLLTADDLTPANLKRLHNWYDDDVEEGMQRKFPPLSTVAGLPVRNEVQQGVAPPDIPVEPYPPASPLPTDGPFGTGTAA